METDGLYDRYEGIFEEVQAPFAFVDLDALEANAAEMLDRATPKPIRVASKSVRCREVLGRIAEIDYRFNGLLCLTLSEAIFLAGHGFRDLVVAYPTTDRHAISELGRLGTSDPDAAPTLMVDDPVQPRSDRVGDRLRRRPDQGRDRHRPRLARVAGHDSDRTEALAYPRRGGRPPPRRGDSRPPRPHARRVDGV